MTRIDKTKYTVPLFYLPFLKEAVEKEGGDFRDMLDKAGINRRLVENTEELLPYRQFKKMVEIILKEVVNENFGLILGRMLNVNSHGDLGVAAMSSRNIHDALLLAIKYVKILMPLLDLQLILQDDYAVIRANTKYVRGALKKFILDVVFASMHTMRSYFLGEKCINALLKFGYKEPNSLREYQKLFGDMVYFSQPYSEYVFPKKDLDVVFPLANPAVRGIAEDRCRKRLELLSNNADLPSLVKKILLEKAGFFPQITEVARKLCVSDRTLKRRLERVDVSYQEILSDTRRELAVKYLLTSSLTVAEISQLLNYSDSSSFGAAFKKWTGVSPYNYREKYSAS